LAGGHAEQHGGGSDDEKFLLHGCAFFNLINKFDCLIVLLD
jgi:hypothetical protein